MLGAVAANNSRIYGTPQALAFLTVSPVALLPAVSLPAPLPPPLVPRSHPEGPRLHRVTVVAMMRHVASLVPACAPVPRVFGAVPAPVPPAARPRRWSRQLERAYLAAAPPQGQLVRQSDDGGQAVPVAAVVCRATGSLSGTLWRGTASRATPTAGSASRSCRRSTPSSEDTSASLSFSGASTRDGTICGHCTHTGMGHGCAWCRPCLRPLCWRSGWSLSACVMTLEARSSRRYRRSKSF
mmetsp:Transcript_51724/g.130798  ORF Transcript_51724/g.130798 Transcript_51724/m.130798 type:complete len:240 (-) Transcript_51724:12-731(-)